MTIKKAKNIAKNLKGKKIGKYLIHDYINNGKSALVCKCVYKGKTYAIKIYDEDLVEESGKRDIMMRIKRQLIFKKLTHKNLIKVFDGGYCKITKNYFLVMEYLNSPNLSSAILNIPRDEIISIVNQIVEAVKFLEKHNTYHRDIKPDNIAISKDYKNIILLDLGVIKPLSYINQSVSYQKNFVGTLQYSPKEFFLGLVEDTKPGWRAVTFYQIGAVLYDLLERKPIFEKYKHPWGNLTQAVLDVKPELTVTDVPKFLIHLVNKCLLKEPQLRLKTVNWEDFNFSKELDENNVEQIKKRITERELMIDSIISADTEVENNKLLFEIDKLFDKSFYKICKPNENCPPFLLQSDQSENCIDKIVCFNNSERFSLCFPLTICFRINILNTKNKIIEIRIAGFLSNKCPTKHMPQTFKIIYSDILNDELMFKKLETNFLYIFDNAQMVKKKNLKILELN